MSVTMPVNIYVRSKCSKTSSPTASLATQSEAWRLRQAPQAACPRARRCPSRRSRSANETAPPRRPDRRRGTPRRAIGPASTISRVMPRRSERLQHGGKIEPGRCARRRAGPRRRACRAGSFSARRHASLAKTQIGAFARTCRASALVSGSRSGCRAPPAPANAAPCPAAGR